MRSFGLFAAVFLSLACSSGSDSGGGAGGSAASGGSSGSGGSGNGGASGSTGGSAGSTGGSAGSTGGSAGSTGGSAGSTGGSAGSGGAAGSTGGSAGSSGSAGSGGTWPVCDAPPSGSVPKTLHELWVDDPAQPVPAWMTGVYITAISGSGCTASGVCQLFVQSAESFPSFAAGAQQALRVVVFPPATTDFLALAVGDRIDLFGRAWRHTNGGQNELHVEISSTHPGCAKKVGVGNPTGTPATLDDLTLAAYETTHGPLLVTLSAVSGKPKQPNETFALFKSFNIEDGGLANVTSMSPFFMAGGVFVGLNAGNLVNFTSLTGVFGLFVPSGSSIKYEEIYVRSQDDWVIGGT